MDIVYILGDFSPWSHNEIRYSLRSLKYVKHDNVWIVGFKPKFLKINHISAGDPYNHKQANAIRKILRACENKEISEDFILMNDDFFFLKDQEIKNYLREDLEEMFKRHPNSKYGQAVKNSIDWLKEKELPLKNYDTHYPMIINKKKFKALMKKFNWEENPIIYRSIYGNYYGIEHAEKVVDFKLRTMQEFEEGKDKASFISISDEVARNPRFAFWIKKMLPEKSNFEI